MDDVTDRAGPRREPQSRVLGGTLLDVEDLTVEIVHSGQTLLPVRQLSLSLDPGEVVALVGESGSGKSVACRAIMGLLPQPGGRITHGSVRLRGRELRELSQREMSGVRGKEIAIVFQDALSSMNPVITIGTQIVEVIRRHLSVDRNDALDRARGLLHMVGIADSRNRVRAYPHEFSGGMRQRAMLAMALAATPSLLIADEPTTALDVTTQAQILELLRRLQSGSQMSILFVTHDLGVAAGIADRIAVMYGGSIVELGPAEQVLSEPLHPYTRGLLQAVPRIDRDSQPRPIPGTPPAPEDRILACSFRPRCDVAIEKCSVAVPPLTKKTENHAAACFVAVGDDEGEPRR